jgi:hypothetical protein
LKSPEKGEIDGKIMQFPNDLQLVISCNALKEIDVNTTSVQFKKLYFEFQIDTYLNLENLAQSQVKLAIVDFLVKASQEYDVFHYRDLIDDLLYTPSPSEINIFKKLENR